MSLRCRDLLLLLLLAGCAGHRAPVGVAARHGPYGFGASSYSRVPPFATVPYEPFSAQAVIAIALREWRLFGQPVDDDPPGSRPPPLPQDKPERMPGLWQRVGEYWWIGQDPGLREDAWTGKHDAYGVEFPAQIDGDYAWSAAFISYVMRIAGAGPRFLYSPTHSDYINAAVEGAPYAARAERPEQYAPQEGDLICESRTRRPMHFDDLPDGRFPAHCDIVVQVAPGLLTVIGGNVDDAVTMKHVPTTASGMLAEPDGTVVDTRYPWFVVLHILYDVPAAPVAGLPTAGSTATGGAVPSQAAPANNGAAPPGVAAPPVTGIPVAAPAPAGSIPAPEPASMPAATSTN